MSLFGRLFGRESARPARLFAPLPPLPPAPPRTPGTVDATEYGSTTHDLRPVRAAEASTSTVAAATGTTHRVAPGVAFTPTQPKSGRRRLVGREVELGRILQALQDDRAHVVLYSERGRGKTSLSNLVVEALRRTGTVVARHTCEATTTFNDLMRGLMQDLPQSLLAAHVGHSTDGCEAALPDGMLRPRDILGLPQRLACRNLVCLVDEFDRVQDPATRTLLADTIKQLSDRDVPLQFLIVGVSESLDQILGQHPSIQRNVLGIHLPLFTDGDVASLIARGGRETSLVFSPAIVARITALARGMPYMAQLLGLRLAQAATARGDTRVLEQDFDDAVDRLLGDASTAVVARYAELTDYGRDADMIMALRHIAGAPQDPWGRLVIVPAGNGAGMLVDDHAVPHHVWERLQSAEVLQSAFAGLFQFAERGLMHHALLLAARGKALAEVPRTAFAEPTHAMPAAIEAALLERAMVQGPMQPVDRSALPGMDGPVSRYAARTPLIPRHGSRYPSMSSG